jgi:hypothetical protein
MPFESNFQKTLGTKVAESQLGEYDTAYKAANIHLVKFTSRRVEKHVYDIDGVVYNIKSALEKYAITKNALNYRCNKTSKKWSQWKKVKLQG